MEHAGCGWMLAARAYHCQEVEGEAVSHIWQKLQQGKFESEKGRFDSWASVVLHHLAADLRKQFSRRLVHSAQQIDSLIEEIPDGRATGTGAAGDAFAQQLDRLRRELDRLSDLLPCETNGVAYFAVFLLQLRLAMARRASQAGFSDPACHSDFIAECLPWHREEGELRFRLGCPALSEVWKPFAHSWASRLTGSQKRGCATSLYVYLANHCVSRRMFGPSGSCVRLYVADGEKATLLAGQPVFLAGVAGSIDSDARAEFSLEGIEESGHDLSLQVGEPRLTWKPEVE